MQIDKPVQIGEALHRISYAQNMEDILLDRLFPEAAGTFVDVGANHPFQDSNTYYFYLRGWRGVNIEPSPQGHALFMKDRPEDLNLSVAVSDVAGEAPFFEISGNAGLTGLSTLSAAVAEGHRANGYEVVEHRVPVCTVAVLIEQYGIAPPDFLSIDVEGQEREVIRGIPLERWRPKVLVVESTLPLTEAASHKVWEPILIENGYLFASFNGINRFYLRDDLRDRLDCFQTPVNVLDHFQRHETIYYLHRLERAQADMESARFYFDQERAGWAWGQQQARHAEAVHELQYKEFEKQRADWAEVFARFGQEHANWAEKLAKFEQARAEWERERRQFSQERAAWEQERAHYQQQLASTQVELRPYRLIDRLGVVTKGYSLARRIKRKLAS